MTEHSPEAIAAYPDYNPSSTMGYIYPSGPVAERIAFDRGRSQGWNEGVRAAFSQSIEDLHWTPSDMPKPKGVV